MARWKTQAETETNPSAGVACDSGGWVQVILNVATQTCLAPQPLQGCVFRAGIGTTAEGVLEYLG